MLGLRLGHYLPKGHHQVWSCGSIFYEWQFVHPSTLLIVKCFFIQLNHSSFFFFLLSSSSLGHLSWRCRSKGHHKVWSCGSIFYEWRFVHPSILLIVNVSSYNLNYSSFFLLLLYSSSSVYLRFQIIFFLLFTSYSGSTISLLVYPQNPLFFLSVFLLLLIP